MPRDSKGGGAGGNLRYRNSLPAILTLPMWGASAGSITTTEEPTCGMELGSRQSQTYPGNMALKTAAPSRSLTGTSNRYVISRATFLGALGPMLAD